LTAPGERKRGAKALSNWEKTTCYQKGAVWASEDKPGEEGIERGCERGGGLPPEQKEGGKSLPSFYSGGGVPVALAREEREATVGSD